MRSGPKLRFFFYLDISYCDLMDEWCLDRISGEYADTLEYLNLSGYQICITLKFQIFAFFGLHGLVTLNQAC